MVKTIQEFKDEVKMLRQELYQKGEYADVKLIASWLDRLLLSLEELAPKLDLMMQDVEELNNAVDALSSGKKQGIKKKIKKAAKKLKKKIKTKKKKKR